MRPLGLLLLLATAASASLLEVRTGRHWYGMRLKTPELSRKVVLLLVWGADEKSREAVTELVPLARRNEEKPFHLLLMHRDRLERGGAVSLLRGLKLPPGPINVTATGPGKHPGPADGEGPYGVVFERNGRVAAQGPWDAAFLERSGRILDALPIIELNRERADYSLIREIAVKVEFRKGMPSALVKAQERMEEAKRKNRPLYKQLYLMNSFVNGYYHDRLKVAEALRAVDPVRVRPFLAAIQKDFKGTTQGETIDRWVESFKKSKGHKAAVALAKRYWKARADFEKQRCCDSCAGQGRTFFAYGCEGCAEKQKHGIRAAIERMEKLHKKAGDHPFAGEIKAHLDELYELTG